MTHPSSILSFNREVFSTLSMTQVLFLSFVIIGFEQGLSDGNICNAMVGHNTTFTTTYMQGGQWTCSSGFSSMYSNGTVIDHDTFNVEQDHGIYVIDSNTNGTECYALQTWNSGYIECITWSPSKDSNSMIGCYVFDAPCIKQCDPAKIGQGWFASIILNPLSD